MKKAQLSHEKALMPAESSSKALVRPNSIQLADRKGEWLHQKGCRAEAPASENLYIAFVKQATRIPRLSEEEETELGRRVIQLADSNAAKKLVLHNMRLCIKMANQYKRQWASLMDLVQEASTGMAIAAQKWDPEKGTRFGTYASYWIKAQLTKFVMTNGRLIHTANTRAGRKVYFNLPQIRRKFLLQGKEPSVAEVAEEVGEDPKEVALILTRLSGNETSIDSPIGEDGASTLQDAIGNQESSPEANAAQNEVTDLLSNIIEKFEKTLENKRDRDIWKYHLVSDSPRSLVDLGAQYNVSKQRMGQLATRIKRAFRRHVVDELGPNTKLSWLFQSENGFGASS